MEGIAFTSVLSLFVLYGGVSCGNGKRVDVSGKIYHVMEYMLIIALSH
jgi:hypothetical protein